PRSLFSNRQRNTCGHAVTCPQMEYAASPCPRWDGSSTRLAACNRGTLRGRVDRSHLDERDSGRSDARIRVIVWRPDSGRLGSSINLCRRGADECTRSVCSLVGESPICVSVGYGAVHDYRGLLLGSIRGADSKDRGGGNPRCEHTL